MVAERGGAGPQVKYLSDALSRRRGAKRMDGRYISLLNYPDLMEGAALVRPEEEIEIGNERHKAPSTI